MSHRMLQVNENLQRELSRLLAEENIAEDALITITQVMVSPDRRQATVWLSIMNHKIPETVIDLLNKRSVEFYRPLSTRLKMKHVPKITFTLDQQADKLSRIDTLLDTIHKEKDEA